MANTPFETQLDIYHSETNAKDYKHYMHNENADSNVFLKMYPTHVLIFDLLIERSKIKELHDHAMSCNCCEHHNQRKTLLCIPIETLDNDRLNFGKFKYENQLIVYCNCKCRMFTRQIVRVLNKPTI